MHGTLVSNKVGKDIPPIRIVLRDLNVWTIDESDLGGILVYTIDAVYHLDSPRKTALTDNEGVADLHPNAKKSNMNNVHMPLRAMCGLVYNMLDIFGQGEHTEKTVEDMLALFHFDMDLLKKCSCFVKTQIMLRLPWIKETCSLVQSLISMQKEYETAWIRGEGWTTITLKSEKIALAAENRSGRDQSGKRRGDLMPSVKKE